MALIPLYYLKAPSHRIAGDITTGRRNFPLQEMLMRWKNLRRLETLQWRVGDDGEVGRCNLTKNNDKLPCMTNKLKSINTHVNQIKTTRKTKKRHICRDASSTADI